MLFLWLLNLHLRCLKVNSAFPDPCVLDADEYSVLYLIFCTVYSVYYMLRGSIETWSGAQL